MEIKYSQNVLLICYILKVFYTLGVTRSLFHTSVKAFS